MFRPQQGCGQPRKGWSSEQGSTVPRSDGFVDSLIGNEFHLAEGVQVVNLVGLAVKRKLVWVLSI
jgi:hypothetical protein